MPPVTPVRRKLLEPPKVSPKPWLPPRPKTSTSTPTKLLNRILKQGSRVQLLNIGEVGRRGNLTGISGMIGYFYKQACEIYVDQPERDKAVMGLLREAEYLEWLHGKKRLEAQVEAEKREERVQMHRKLMALKELLRLQAQERAKKRRAEAAKHERDVRERRERVASFRQQTSVEAPPRMSRNPLGHVIRIARM